MTSPIPLSFVFLIEMLSSFPLLCVTCHLKSPSTPFSLPGRTGASFLLTPLLASGEKKEEVITHLAVQIVKQSDFPRKGYDFCCYKNGKATDPKGLENSEEVVS